jgi:DNA-directed RNA polymerase subunit M/transcription elongation factor TFIIS
MAKFCDNCKSIIAFKKVKTWNPSSKTTLEETKAYCPKCGILADPVDPSSYRMVQAIDHSQDKTIIIDRVSLLKEAKEKLGVRTYGSACPDCKSFYFTAHRVVTRGDEAGKTFLMCLVCGKQFRQPIYIPPPTK